MDKLILAIMFALMLSFNVIAGETVTIIDPAGELQREIAQTIIKNI